MMSVWLARLAYGLRVTEGWFGAIALALVLLRLGFYNAKILRRFYSQLQLAGVSLSQSPPGLIRTPLWHYWELLRVVPELADDEAEVWARRLQELHEELREASEQQPGERKLVMDRDARALQFEFLQRFFRNRLQIELAPPGDAFAGYLPGVEGLRDFFDFCSSHRRLTSREEVEKSLEEFARQVREYRLRFSRNPPKAYFQQQPIIHQPLRERLRKLLHPTSLLTQIYWGKNHFQRVSGRVSLPPWAAKLIIKGAYPPRELPRHLLRSILKFEMSLQALRVLVDQCRQLNSFSPSLRLVSTLQQAIEDLQRCLRRLG